MLNDVEQKIRIENEPQEVAEIRDKILSEFDGLEFIEEGHKYFLNGVAYPSVSQITHKCQIPFD